MLEQGRARVHYAYRLADFEEIKELPHLRSKKPHPDNIGVI